MPGIGGMPSLHELERQAVRGGGGGGGGGGSGSGPHGMHRDHAGPGVPIGDAHHLGYGERRERGRGPAPVDEEVLEEGGPGYVLVFWGNGRGSDMHAYISMYMYHDLLVYMRKTVVPTHVYVA